uniref:LTXXQ motif family protein n=1 Tax=Candidatus Kentrum sp. LFY TaxID=2126342 RepID=A0A450X391_9GAMM|nr:MAG: hypothetical protein BECKLFY1418C_GA0070996_11542 [Candidatus Kentron sp. LFY]
MNKKITMGFVAILAMGLSGAGAAEIDRGRLSAVQIKGLRDIGQAVLISRKKQRDGNQGSELRQKIRQYHQSLARLQSEMSKTTTDASAWSVDSSMGRLVRRKGKSGKSPRSGKGRTHDRLIDTAIQARRDLYEMLGAPERGSKGNQRRSANRAALRKKMDEHAVQLEQLKKKGPRQRLEIVARLIERSKIRKGRKIDADKSNTPMSRRDDSQRHPSTPTITTATRHRHRFQ